MLDDRLINPITPAEKVKILRLFFVGLLLRLAVVLVLHFSAIERTLKLTQDASLYDRMGKQIANYFRNGGETNWPFRVSNVLGHLYEYFVGITYYLTDDSVLAVRVVNALCGSLVILVTWRMARYFTNADTAFRCGLGACFFPTMIYYSCLPVRDAQSTLGMALVFLGMTAITSSGKQWHMMALPLGLLLTAGYRAYMAFALVMLIPLAWLVTLLVTRSNEDVKLVRRNLIIALLAAAVICPVAVAKLSSTRKVEKTMSIDSWNRIRKQLNTGSGALYEDGAVPGLGESAVETVQSVAIGIYFFFVSVNPTEIRSVRQCLALPEVLLVLYMMPSLWRGVRRVMRQHRFEFLSVLIVVAAITLAYSSATTNAGPLLRWRLQVANVYIVLAVIGFAASYSDGRGDETVPIQ